MATAAKAKVETISTRQLASQLAEKHELSQKSANAMLEDTIGLITKHPQIADRTGPIGDGDR